MPTKTVLPTRVAIGSSRPCLGMSSGWHCASTNTTTGGTMPKTQSPCLSCHLGSSSSPVPGPKGRTPQTVVSSVPVLFTGNKVCMLWGQRGVEGWEGAWEIVWEPGTKGWVGSLGQVCRMGWVGSARGQCLGR